MLFFCENVPSMVASDVAKGDNHVLTGAKRQLQEMGLDQPSLIFTSENLQRSTGDLIAPLVCIAVSCESDLAIKYVPYLEVEEQAEFIEYQSSIKNKGPLQQRSKVKRCQELEVKLNLLKQDTIEKDKENAKLRDTIREMELQGKVQENSM
ncbi:hypothetical protein L7F22_020036 [Adiantum nelumboides]|nr:hypothetical protein [Adiantum nelumboides]